MLGFFPSAALPFVPIESHTNDVLRLGEGGDLTTNVHTKHTLQIYEKLSYEALNRHFCQTAVSGWASLFSVCQQHFLSC
jgi:hypothetical protein